MSLRKFLYTVSLTNITDGTGYTITNTSKEDQKQEKQFLGIEFNVLKSSFQNFNKSNIKIYNLSSLKRDMHVKDILETQKKIILTLTVGDENKGTGLIFQGQVYEARNKKEGASIISEITAFDGGYNVENAMANFSLGENVNVLDLKTEYARAMGMDLYSQSQNDNYKLQQGWSVYARNAFLDLKELFPREDIFIDNGKLNCLDEAYYQQQLNQGLAFIPEISEITGLLKTPINKGNTVIVHSTLRTELKRGDLVKLNATAGIDNRFNGFYKIAGLEHDGYISCQKSDSNTTTFELRKLGNPSLFF